jgi:hypothetical protein
MEARAGPEEANEEGILNPMQEPRFAQHAQLQGLHLETLKVSGGWEWKVFGKKPTPISGTAHSLEEAKAAAIKEAGIRGPVRWKDIGPELS